MMDPNERQSILQLAYVISYAEKNAQAYNQGGRRGCLQRNQIFNLIKEVFLGGELFG